MPPKTNKTRTNTGDSLINHAPNSSVSPVPKRGVSDAALRAAKPAAKPFKIAAGGGLYLEVMPSGSKLWRWKYRIGGKENRLAVGAYPDLLLSVAREKAEAARKLVKAGVHPSHQKHLDRIKVQHEHANTFEAIAKEWLALKDWEQVTKDKRLQMLERVVFPSIGLLPVRQIVPAHILDILKKTVKHAPTVAAEAQRTMSGIFELAISTLRADTDPVYPVRKSLPANKTQHKRPLSSDEIGQLLRDLDTQGGNYQTGCAFRLMWLTLARPGEVIEAQWSEFDLDGGVWRIPAERMKKRKEHASPLPHQAVELLRGMYTITGHSTHVFPHRDIKTKPMTTAAFRQMLFVLGWSGKYSPHATRTTGSTRLNEMGYSADWIERQLAHDEPNAVRRTYNHADYLADRAKMMQQWANLLDDWKKGESKVIAIKSKTAA
ncbi:MAG: tyrosine-type recombinase/integrase [Candidatus Nitrotoga sp.]|nr:tyrosine-type recombinase/integrase [Candidatus Nitrotoga sp.]